MIGAFLGREPQALDFDEAGAILDEIYEEIEASFYEDVIPLRIVLPLEGLESDSGLSGLPEDVTLARLPHTERRMIEYPMGMLDTDLHPRHEWCFEKTLLVPKVLDDLPKEAAIELNALQEGAVSLLVDCVLLLRAWKDGRVTARRALIGSSNWMVRGYRIVATPHLGSGQVFDRYELTANELPELETFLGEALSPAVRGFRSLRVATRRFGSASHERDMEDSLIDLMICAEALLLSAAGDARRRGELRYRLSNHGAFLLGGDAKERRELARLFGRLYDERSAVVHGGYLNAARVKDDLPEGVAAIRRALTIAISAKAGGSWPPDWNTLVYGAG